MADPAEIEPLNVVSIRADGVIPAIVSPPNQELIEKLEELLTDARSGHLRAIGYVLIDRNRAIANGWSGKADHHDMTAGVNLLAYRYMSTTLNDD